MQDPVGVQVLAAVEQLEHDALDGLRRHGMARLLCVVVDDLQQVVLGVLKDHEDGFILQDDLVQADDVGVAELAAERHLAHGGLRDARVGDDLALLVGLELLDGKLGPAVRLSAESRFVDAAIGTGADEADDFVAVDYTYFGLVADWAKSTAVSGI